MKRQRGQGMVEFALILIVLIIIVAGMIDVAPLMANWFVAKSLSAKGARAAAVYYPDGSRTCYNDVMNSLGSPIFIHASWSVEIDPDCTNSPASVNPSGLPMYVTVSVNYEPLFWGGFGYPPVDTASSWPFQVSTVDQVR